jgi:hypothetical protein
MPDLNKIFIFRMTHIENIAHILKNGITHSGSGNANRNFIPIGDSSLISSRNSFLLKNGRLLGEYTPFYFSYRTPMLYVIQNGFNMVSPIEPENIVYCFSTVRKIIDLDMGFIFTDGHAVDGFSSQFTEDDIDKIDILLDWEAIKSKYWKDEKDLDRKRRKEAEFLVLGDIDCSAIIGFITYNEIAKNKIINFGADKAKVHIREDFYF